MKEHGCGRYLCTHQNSLRCGDNYGGSKLFCSNCQPVCRLCGEFIDDDYITDDKGMVCYNCADAMNQQSQDKGIECPEK